MKKTKDDLFKYSTLILATLGFIIAIIDGYPWFIGFLFGIGAVLTNFWDYNLTINLVRRNIKENEML